MTRSNSSIALYPSASAKSRWFATEIIRMHDRLTFGGLLGAITGDPLFLLRGAGDGITTLCVHDSQLPDRYRRALLGFRLAKFLQIGFMDPEIVHGCGMHIEPVAALDGPGTIHGICISARGKIIGYMALVGSPDPVPRPLDSAERARFPAEMAHRVDLLDRFAAPGIDTHRVVEIKRLIRDPSLPTGPQTERVPWHLILGLGRAVLQTDARLVLGDAHESGALRHLRALGFRAVVVEGTEPKLGRDELMWPSYDRDKPAKPFVAMFPEDFGAYMDLIEGELRSPHDGGWQRRVGVKLAALGRAQATRTKERA
ncbi:hypothetical protein [Glycomyces arizonensis]|uniref:hypothetical protein n=1 Tax=Glycomyces arizonensis TaxID=256035 RepID=UPI00047C8940|nr:hypothetical protein [Glycomyces arizonensis]